MNGPFLTAAEVDGLRRIVATTEALDDAVGGWTTSANNRQTGCSLHLRFANKVEVMTTMQFVQLLEQAPGLLLTTAKKLLAAHDSQSTGAVS